MKILFSIAFLFCSLFANEFTKKINIVNDNVLNIMWQDDEESLVNIEDITLAKTYCDTLVLNGFIDWKMPTIKQLQRVIDIKQKEAKFIKEFKYKMSTKYWTITKDVQDDEVFWLVDFKDGKVSKDKRDEKHHFRCIRDIK